MNGLGVVRGGWGIVALSLPDLVVGRVLHAPLDRRTRTVIRVLGARHCAQAVLSGGTPTPRVLATGAGVDAVHGLTMLVLAVLDPPRRRLALTSAALAAAFAAAGVISASRPPRTRPVP